MQTGRQPEWKLRPQMGTDVGPLIYFAIPGGGGGEGREKLRGMWGFPKSRSDLAGLIGDFKRGPSFT